METTAKRTAIGLLIWSKGATGKSVHVVFSLEEFKRVVEL